MPSDLKKKKAQKKKAIANAKDNKPKKVETNGVANGVENGHSNSENGACFDGKYFLRETFVSGIS